MSDEISEAGWHLEMYIENQLHVTSYSEPSLFNILDTVLDRWTRKVRRIKFEKKSCLTLRQPTPTVPKGGTLIKRDGRTIFIG